LVLGTIQLTWKKIKPYSQPYLKPIPAGQNAIQLHAPAPAEVINADIFARWRGIQIAQPGQGEKRS
jgi:hypothetical protein